MGLPILLGPHYCLKLERGLLDEIEAAGRGPQPAYFFRSIFEGADTQSFSRYGKKRWIKSLGRLRWVIAATLGCLAAILRFSSSIIPNCGVQGNARSISNGPIWMTAKRCCIAPGV